MLHDAQMDVDYWLRSEVGEVSITDMWPNECILDSFTLSLCFDIIFSLSF